MEVERTKVEGRQRVEWTKKLNPIWWFGNEAEQTVDEAAWYHPEWPEWRRRLWWNLRNPFQNFRSFVVGVQDKNYSVWGRSPVLTVQRNDLTVEGHPDEGWQWSVLYGDDLWLPRPFVSYSGRRVVWYFGWQPSGFFGWKLNLHKAGT